MSKYQKSKYTFTLGGIKYTDISGWNYDDSPKRISINVAGTAQMVRQYMRAKYPQFAKQGYYWVQSETYSMGDNITIYFNNAPDDLYQKIYKELKSKFQEGFFDGMNDIYNNTKEDETSKEGFLVSYGTKYFKSSNKPPYGTEAEPVDWSVSAKSSYSSGGGKRSYGASSTFDYGTMLKECSGWMIYKKTLNDGRVVYAGVKKKDTPPNKEDWNAIKGDVYTSSGFKWGKFGTFEKWGNISNESETLENLCKTLDKYYKGKQEEKPAYTQEELRAAIAALESFAAKGNELAAKQANVLKYLLK